MNQVIIKKGKIVVENIPLPAHKNGFVLIKVNNSCISSGTEIGNIKESGKTILDRLFHNPQMVEKAIKIVKHKGFLQSYADAKNKLNLPSQTGYSISGIVVEVGDGVEEFKIGDAVAAAGVGYANHSEYVNVPKNLVMKIPVGLSFEYASTVALGGIALQGLRRAKLSIGEFVVIVGAGIIGLLSLQLLIRAGIRVAVVDIDERRLSLAKELGAEMIINPRINDTINDVFNWTGSCGADAVIFAASTSESNTLSMSFKMCRKKGRVILVGVSGMKVKREDIYSNEIDFLISTSYGPGRYDKNYEEKGIDYPYGYVRWTEKRNMLEYLRNLQLNYVKLEKLIEKEFNIEDANAAFDFIESSNPKPLIVLLRYNNFTPNKTTIINSDTSKKVKKIKLSSEDGRVNVGLVGTGNFASEVLIPNLDKLKKMYRIYAVMNRSGVKSKYIADKYEAKYYTSDYNTLLKDPNIDLILISTTHESHAKLTLEALKAGKNVFVEKPLSTDVKELQMIEQFFKNMDDKNEIAPILMVGFNRRFSPIALVIKECIKKRINPLFMHYRINAGYASSDSWLHDYGGRIVGEACHFIDLATFWVNSSIRSLNYESLSPLNNRYSSADNKAIILKYNDGSICNIEYFSTGNINLGKEYVEIHFDGNSIIMEDFKKIRGYGVKLNEINSKKSIKGHLEEFKILYDHISNDHSSQPIPLNELFETTLTSILISKEFS